MHFAGAEGDKDKLHQLRCECLIKPGEAKANSTHLNAITAIWPGRSHVMPPFGSIKWVFSTSVARMSIIKWTSLLL